MELEAPIVVFPLAVKLPVRVVFPVTAKVEERVVAPETVRGLETVKAAPEPAAAKVTAPVEETVVSSLLLASYLTESCGVVVEVMVRGPA